MSAGGLSFRTSADGLLRSGYRGGKPLRHPNFSTDKPSLPAIPVTAIAPCTSISHRECLRLRLWFAIYGVAGAHTAFYATSGIGLLRRADTRCLTLRQAQCSVVACPATPNGSPMHTQCLQSAGSPFPFPASPMLSLRSGLSVGCAYPKSSTMLLARQAHHRPLNTCPHRHNHKIKAQAS